MKFYFICAIFLISIFTKFEIIAQPFDIQAGIFNPTTNNLEIRAIPASNISNLIFGGVNFTIRWLASYNVSLGTSSSAFGITKNGSENTALDGGINYKYQVFSGTDNPNVTWNAGQQITLLTVPIVQSGNGTGIFELAQQGFITGGEWYIEIGGVDRTNPNFNPGSIDAPLSIELNSFTVFVNKEIVNLTWQTRTEVNNYGFEVERSQKSEVRSQSNIKWEKIGFVEGSGNSNSPKEYSFTDKNPSGGSKFIYRLKQIDSDGSFSYSDEVEVELVPDKFELFQNYPNPFNPVTNIKFSLPANSEVRLDIYNIIGEHLTTLINKEMEAGFYSIAFDAVNLPSGTYIYRITAPDFSQSRKMLLIK